jgi:hypothetical protein
LFCNLKLSILTRVRATGKGKRYPEMIERKMEPGMANVCRKRYVTKTPPKTCQWKLKTLDEWVVLCIQVGQLSL